jgi:spore coat polysaccharide biosynthesis protein SpsF (cytidylyltransferase family)
VSVLAFIQARVGSMRLPGKVLMDLGGKPVLQRVMDRVARAEDIDGVAVLTTMSVRDLPIARLCADAGILIYCGSENDVLDRYYQAAQVLRPDHIVRITADCPVLDPAVVNLVVRTHLSSGADYSSNTITERYPDGEDVEVFSFAALERAWTEARLASEREHVTPFIRNHPEIFRIESVSCAEDHSAQRWTLDTEKDYRFLSALYRELGPSDEFFGMGAILRLLEGRADFYEINSGIARNEGLMKSLREDFMA